MNIALIFYFPHQFSAVLIVDEYILLLHRQLGLGLLEEIEDSSIFEMDKYVSKQVGYYLPSSQILFTLQMFRALNRTYYSLQNFLPARPYLLISTNPWSYFQNLGLMFLAFTWMTNRYPSLSVNFYALALLFDVDMNPNIQRKSPYWSKRKSLFLTLAPRYRVMLGRSFLVYFRQLPQNFLMEWYISLKGRMQGLNYQVVLRVRSIEFTIWQQNDSRTQNSMICLACSMEMIGIRCLILVQSDMFDCYFQILPYFYRTSIKKYQQSTLRSSSESFIEPQRLARQRVAQVLSRPLSFKKLGNFFCFILASKPLLILQIYIVSSIYSYVFSIIFSRSVQIPFTFLLQPFSYNALLVPASPQSLQMQYSTTRTLILYLSAPYMLPILATILK